ncbi:MAG: DUF58 domain-containing protein [Clostridia bacterium]|nr:DUF58 domain-containing protein [Clostridia bacterium]
MLFIAIFAALFLVLLWQGALYRKKSFDDLRCRIQINVSEAFVGEDVYLFEEITNAKRLPLPYLKVEDDLPDGLAFVLYDTDPKTGRRQTRQVQHLQSLFSLAGNSGISRRWRVHCLTRGIYRMDGLLLLCDDILGLGTVSRRLSVNEGEAPATLVVLPSAIDLEGEFAVSRYLSGDVVRNHCPISDPLRICGSREYTMDDPMNRINWKSTAAHGSLMVNVEEKTQRERFNLILNMQSRGIERDPEVPSNTAAIEQCITVCASILDRVAAANLPMRLIVNTSPESFEESVRVDDEGIGAQVLMTPVYEGRRDTMTALRLLAALPLRYSCAITDLLSHIVEHPEAYAEEGSLVLVTAYIDQHMLNTHAMLAAKGISLIFYVTTTQNNVMNIPPEVEVYYKT